MTIKDVANHANVATSTVSRVIANHYSISEKTKKRVREAMEELGYHPNFNARNLAIKKTNTMGVIVPDLKKIAFQNQFFPEIIRGISMKAYQEGYGLYLSTGQTAEDIMAEVENMVYEKRVDGLLLLYANNQDQIVPFLLKQNFPFTLIGRPAHIDESLVTYVNTDNHEAARTVTEHLLSLGHKRIAYIGGNPDYVVTIDRVSGFKQAMNEAGLPVREEYILNHDQWKDGQKEALQSLMSQNDRPTALIVPDDMLTFSILRILQDMKIAVPNDVSIVSFNNVMISELSSPRMTTVDIHIYDLGFQATSCLIDKINHPNAGEKSVMVPYELIVRETSVKTGYV